MTLIYIINGKVSFYENLDDKTGGIDLYKELVKKHGCEPVIIPVNTDSDSEFELTGKITPEQILHLMAQTIYNPSDKTPVTYEVTATAPDELNFGKKGELPAPYIFDGITITRPSVKSEPEMPQENEKIIAYTDGSFNIKNNTAGYAAILKFENGYEKVLHGSITDPKLTTLRNVAGELQAVLEAIKAAEEARADLVVYYDYEGIEKWVTGEWKAKKEFTRQYRNAVLEASVKIEFYKVVAHTGVEYNERADKLAKAACGM